MRKVVMMLVNVGTDCELFEVSGPSFRPLEVMMQ